MYQLLTSLLTTHWSHMGKEALTHLFPSSPVHLLPMFDIYAMILILYLFPLFL